MRVVIVHNEYGKFSGEEAVVRGQANLLQSKGHKVSRFTRSSVEIPNMFLGNARAFFSGIYSFSSKKAMQCLLDEYHPDVVNVHNVFPLISPSILSACRESSVPVVMTVHNYRLVCANGLHLHKRTLEICERCCGGREYWCFLQNCECSYARSIGYFLRNYVARRFRLFLDNVSLYICLTEFHKRRLISEGFPEDRLHVIPNMYREYVNNNYGQLGEYVGFVGRISLEKGIGCLLEASRRLGTIPFKVAGELRNISEMATLSPRNLEFFGHISSKRISAFYQQSRLIILPSIWFEGFPMVLIEAMLHARPIVASRIGGLSEIVDDGVNGLLFEPGNLEELMEKIQYLWERPAMCREMGEAGRKKALREYSPEKYYERLMAVYKKVL